jgi:hypothetical protein
VLGKLAAPGVCLCYYMIRSIVFGAIYGDEQAEVILGQLILTNAVGNIPYQELKNSTKNPLNLSDENGRKN